MFKIIEDLNPAYMAVAFDLKGPTARHEMYEGYKANRKGMPNELAEQMPIIKDVLHAMNIDVIEKTEKKQPTPRFCSKCGAPLNSGAKFCAKW